MVTRRGDESRWRTFVLGGALLALALVAPAGEPATAAQSAAPSPAQSIIEMWLEGTIGTSPIRAFIGVAGYPKTAGLWGTYYETERWDPLTLDGDWVGSDRMQLSEGDPSDDGPKPRLELTVSSGTIVTGTWSSADRRQTRPVRLNRVAKPLPFAAAVRRSPRRFADPRWPITLSYPAGWRLDVNDSSLRLRSPDAETVMFDDELSCDRGVGVPAPPAPGEPPVEFQWPFFRGSSGWLAEERVWGECTMDESCRAPSVRPMANGTFMKGTMAYRAGGPWGYAGLAEASAYLMLFGNEWVSCTDRLLDSDTRIEAAAPRSAIAPDRRRAGRRR